MKRIQSLLILPFLVCIQVNAQQITHLSQYMYEGMVINPASTNTMTMMRAALHHRSQWTGFSGAPVTQYLSVDGIAKKKSNYGFGGFIFNDMAGPVRNTGLNLTFAYRVQLTSKAYLSMGLGGSMSQFAVNGNKMILTDENDQLINQNSLSVSYKPNFSTGMYVYDETAFLGISALQISQPRINVFTDKSSAAMMRMKRHIYITAGKSFKLDKGYSIAPSLLLSYVGGNPMQLSINANLIIDELGECGIGYRTNDALIFLFNLKRWKEFSISYSYDLQLFRMIKYSGGSHEIMFCYYLDKF